MSEAVPEQPHQQPRFAQRTYNSNVMTTALTCSILMVIFALCFRLVCDDGGGGGYDQSDNLMKKLAQMENRIDALSKALRDEERKYVNGRCT